MKPTLITIMLAFIVGVSGCTNQEQKTKEYNCYIKFKEHLKARNFADSIHDDLMYNYHQKEIIKLADTLLFKTK